MKKLIALCCLSAILFSISSCKSSDKETHVIGALVSLTGGAAAYGEDIKNGTELAVSEINEKHDFNLQVVYRDTRSNKNEAIKASEDLITLNSVLAILGPTISPNAIVVGQICDQYQVPMIVQAATQNEVTHSAEYQRQFVSRICFNDSFQGAALANFATGDIQKKTAIIIFDQSVSYSVGLANSFEKQFVMNGGQVVSRLSYSVSDRDFRALIDRVARLDADLLFIPGWDENVGPMLRQSEDKWDKFIILGGDGWPTNKLFELSANNLKNVYALAHYDPTSAEAKAAEFQKNYLQKYGIPATPHAALGYDAVYVLKKALINCGDDVNRIKLNEQIRKTVNFKGVTGNISINDKGDAGKNGIILRIKPDGFEFFKSIEVH